MPQLTRFINQDIDRITRYEEMIRRISEEANISRSLIWEIITAIWTDWEKEHALSPSSSNVRDLKKVLDHHEINTIVDRFHKDLHPLIPSKEILNRHTELIRNTFLDIFEID